MTIIKLHDTAALKKRVFVPSNPARVTMYVCGPTVYSRAHIGNARPAVIFDVLSRLLRHVYGMDAVTYARNVTDVDDKIIDEASAEGVHPSVIARRFEELYLADMGALGVRPPDIAPKATAHVPGVIAMISKLLEGGFAYETHGHVLFHVPSDLHYGALGRRDRDAMIAGARVEVASYKKDPADFVLWKPSPPEAIGWDSPWGRGRAGWHIGCSAMIAENLGETIDIHGGGLDLVFPHHENESAQSRSAHAGSQLARYWLHNGFLTMTDTAAGVGKMSKSLGNVVSVGELLERGHGGETLRLALLSAHYRQPLEWNEALLSQTKTILDRLYRRLKMFSFIDDEELGIDDCNQAVVDALADDLNTPLALSKLVAIDDPKSLIASGMLLGLFSRRERWFRFFLDGPSGESDHVARLIDARTDAKSRKDFAEADRIRAELTDLGIALEDGPTGTTWRRL